MLLIQFVLFQPDSMAVQNSSPSNISVIAHPGYICRSHQLHRTMRSDHVKAPSSETAELTEVL
jgi:hypothetical protein